MRRNASFVVLAALLSFTGCSDDPSSSSTRPDTSNLWATNQPCEKSNELICCSGGDVGAAAICVDGKLWCDKQWTELVPDRTCTLEGRGYPGMVDAGNDAGDT